GLLRLTRPDTCLALIYTPSLHDALPILSRKRQALVDVLGIALLLLPVSVFILSVSWDYVEVSWRIREGSREAGGLPYPFVPLLKSAIPLASILLVIEGVAALMGRVLVLAGFDGAAARLDAAA